MRYNPYLQESLNFVPYEHHRIVYDGVVQEFYIVDLALKKYSYLENLSYFKYVGILEYDSRTRECSFIYDNWWDNFKENYKWVIFLCTYLLTFAVCFLMIVTCRKLSNKKIERD
ncbi:MAG: hypothetical protein K8S87_10830 [Planctomycetes bacterium]|nr:hypothetical protein [Planctomycetota bacterium]